MQAVSTKRFAILVFPNFPLMAFSSVIEPLRAANILSGQQCYSWTTVGPAMDRLKASNGVAIELDHDVRYAPLVDRVVVCSGGNADQITAEEALNWIRRNLRAGCEIGAVADGAFLLARAGLLDGHACTLHWTSQPAFREAFPEIEMRRDLYVIDRKRFTSAGGVASLDMMLDLIARDHGGELASGVAEWFMHSPLRSSVDRRMMPIRLRTGIRDELVLSAVAIMEDAVEERLDMGGLARRLKISPDTLERAFRAELKTTPGGHYRSLRLKRAADLLTHSSLAVGEVAIACGFASPASFSRAFRETFGCTPLEMRARKSIAGEAPRPAR